MNKHEETPERIFLWDDEHITKASADGFKPFMELYPVKTKKKLGGVLVCPGGGYGHRAPHEGGVIAKAFNDKGFHAFVLQYRISPNRHPAPLNDATRAMRILRKNASKWNLNPEKIADCGFSAGGHLAGCLGIHHELNKCPCDDLADKISARPDAMILCYPVISAYKKFGHQGSFNNLLGENATEQNRQLLSLEKHITETTPPTFLWHTADDASVPIENSLAFAIALKEKNVPFELHVYPQGPHGLGLAPKFPNIASWFELCCVWLENMGWKA